MTRMFRLSMFYKAAKPYITSHYYVSSKKNSGDFLWELSVWRFIKSVYEYPVILVLGFSESKLPEKTRSLGELKNDWSNLYQS